MNSQYSITLSRDLTHSSVVLSNNIKTAVTMKIKNIYNPRTNPKTWINRLKFEEIIKVRKKSDIS